MRLQFLDLVGRFEHWNRLIFMKWHTLMGLLGTSSTTFIFNSSPDIALVVKYSKRMAVSKYAFIWAKQCQRSCIVSRISDLTSHVAGSPFVNAVFQVVSSLIFCICNYILHVNMSMSKAYHRSHDIKVRTCNKNSLPFMYLTKANAVDTL